MIKNLVPSYWKLLLAFFGIKQMSKMAKERLSECKKCSNGITCPPRDCPCPLIAIVQEESETCPLNKWQ